MTPGPTIVYKIPGTGTLVKIGTIGSGNTFGARFWTDGKMIAPMLSDEPWLQRHPGTGETFWTDECEEIASEDHWCNVSQYPDVRFAEDAEEEDLQAELHSESLTPEKEEYLRIRLWWKWNDPIREGSESVDRPDEFTPNLQKLVALLSEDEDDTRLMKAEAFRELGEHEKASELLNQSFPENFMGAVNVIREANENRNVRPLEITKGD